MKCLPLGFFWPEKFDGEREPHSERGNQEATSSNQGLLLSHPAILGAKSDMMMLPRYKIWRIDCSFSQVDLFVQGCFDALCPFLG